MPSAGDVTSALLLLAPCRALREIKRDGAVGNYSPLSYMAMLLNSAVWVLYALPMMHADSMPVLAISAGGVAIELVYLAIFFYYGARRSISIGVIFEVVVLGVEALVVIVLVQDHELRSTITGVIGSVCSCAMYVSPLHSVYQVYKTGNVQYLDRGLTYASLANAICWVVYSSLRFDPYVMIPNIIGVLCGLAQLLVYHIYNAFEDLENLMAEIELV